MFYINTWIVETCVKHLNIIINYLRKGMWLYSFTRKSGHILLYLIDDKMLFTDSYIEFPSKK